MCTVVLQVPEAGEPGGPFRLLAVRDEHPDRPWDELGEWWPDAPGVFGVRDRKAGGAWLTIDPEAGSLGVILNRGEPVEEHGRPLETRGKISLNAVTGDQLPEEPHTAAFNLLHIADGVAHLTQWNGKKVRTDPIAAGVHMVAHTGLNDLETARIAAWLPKFRGAILGQHDSVVTPHGRGSADWNSKREEQSWRDSWLLVLEASTEAVATDNRAIVRDNRPYGIPTLSLYAVMVEITPATPDGPAHVAAWHAHLDTPGEWHGEVFEPVSF